MDNLVARMKAHALGREPTPEEIEESNRIQEEALGLASGVMGSVGRVAPQFGRIRQMLGGAEQAAPAELGMAEKIKQAALQGKTKWLDLPQDAERTMFKEQFKGKPSFFEKYGAKEATVSNTPDNDKLEALKRLLGQK